MCEALAQPLFAPGFCWQNRLMPTSQATRDLDRMRWLVDGLRAYHSHEVLGLEHVPAEGAALLVVNHSLATYDSLLLGSAIIDHIGRFPAGLGDDLIFKIPRLRDLARGVGISPASPKAGLELLQEGQLLAVAPGGMHESLRSKQERYQVRWADRRGFVRLAIQAQVPLILAGCGAADRIYSVYKSSITELAYALFKLPVPLARGLGPTAIPRPVRLLHKIAPPIIPPPPSEDPEQAQRQLDALHTRCIQTMEALLKDTAHPNRAEPR